MAVPSAMTDLTVDEATNVPADSETVTPALRPSDYLRSHAAIMRRPFAKGADVASATAANLGSNTDGDYFHITGTAGLDASNFGTVAAGIERTIVFDGALPLTHNATSFILPGGANITTAAGDVAVFRSEGSGNWKCTSYVKASGAPIGSYQPLDATLTALASALTAANKIPYATATDTLGELDFKDEDNMASDSATALPSQQSVKAYVDTSVAAVPTTGRVLQIVESTSGAVATGATTIPNDDTIPQNTEGVEFLTRAITPANASNTLLIEGCLYVSGGTSGRMQGGLFQDTTAGALASSVILAPSINFIMPLPFSYKMAAGTTSATTFKLRAGADSGNITLNGTGSSRIYGGALLSWLRITEIAA